MDCGTFVLLSPAVYVTMFMMGYAYSNCRRVQEISYLRDENDELTELVEIAERNLEKQTKRINRIFGDITPEINEEY